MTAHAMAVYEDGVLRLLTPVALPERARVRVQILTEEETEDEVHQAEAALIAAGLVKPMSPSSTCPTVSKSRRAELARLYAVGGPLSQGIIAERDVR